MAYTVEEVRTTLIGCRVVSATLIHAGGIILELEDRNEHQFILTLQPTGTPFLNGNLLGISLGLNFNLQKK